jgi:hypothetical protein
VARHVLRRPPEQQHQVPGVSPGPLPLVREAMPPPVRVHVRYPSCLPQPLEPDLDAVRS